jgi:imidazoleglycerol-phosphate dehydratase
VWRSVAAPDKRRGHRASGDAMRKGVVRRATKETEVEVELDLDGRGVSTISTGIGFLDHMLDLLARHSRINLVLKAKGDLHVDHHHTTEDVGIALGQAVRQALGDMKGITRYADVHVPMDEALTRVALDVSGRPLLVFKTEFLRDKVGTFDTALVQEWFQAFAMNSGLTLHVATLYGSNDHHIAESCFKGLARALRAAIAIDASAANEVPSTKGSLGT